MIGLNRAALAWVRLGTVAFVLGGLPALVHAADDEGSKKAAGIHFKRMQLDATFRSEGVAVGDFNNDGKMDIAAGSVWYEAPDWEMHSVLDEPAQYDPLNYSNSFCNWAEDVNGDGWTDLIVADFPGKETWWFENPQSAGGPWKRHVVTPVTNNESPTLLDIDGDGRRELLLGFSPNPDDTDGPERRMGIARRGSDPYQLWSLSAISDKGAPGAMRYSHGLGVGDVNGDGRQDVLVKEGWWEAPADGTTPWKLHAVDFGENCAQMHVYDFDGDGDSDVLTSAAHQVGIWWHE
ncbi:MAG: VCBS repeat-containing protein, partial [Pirellulales bacterium]